LCLLFFLPLCFAGCTAAGREKTVVAGESAPVEPVDPAAALEPIAAPAADIRLAEYRERAARIAAALDDRTLAAQVIMTGIDGNGALTEPMRVLLQEVPAGAIMLFRYNLNIEVNAIRPYMDACAALIAGASRSWSNPVQGEAADFAEGIPPFIAVDHEGGSIHRFGAGVERLPSPASYYEAAGTEGQDRVLNRIEETARRSGEELRSLGITMNLAPVAEVLNGDNAAFLEDRSFGPDPAFAEAAAGAFIRGMTASGVACVVKHFPGHSGTDPHEGAAILTQNRAGLDQMVRPFAAIIRTLNPPAIMVSHALVPAWDGEHNASLSPVIIRDWLRRDLGFGGIILGDDFSMGALAASGLGPAEAAVEALIAGVDMVMTWPADLRRTHRAILAALADGSLSRERLQEAASRIIFEKIRFELIR
jgi:beta-N-acetylhexosaminidase